MTDVLLSILLLFLSCGHQVAPPILSDTVKRKKKHVYSWFDSESHEFQLHFQPSFSETLDQSNADAANYQVFSHTDIG